jgi:hypothetical protein
MLYEGSIQERLMPVKLANNPEASVNPTQEAPPLALLGFSAKWRAPK